MDEFPSEVTPDEITEVDVKRIKLEANVEDEPELVIKSEPYEAASIKQEAVDIKTEEVADEVEILELRVTLRYVAPEIWRTIQVPALYTFSQLHHAANQAMGWEDVHLHKFTAKSERVQQAAFMDVDLRADFEPGDLDERETVVGRFLREPGDSAVYYYDFGDNWQHDVVLQRRLTAGHDELDRFPKCVDGRRACPPEDCGGIGSFECILEFLRNPADSEHEDYKEWLEEVNPEYDPDAFDPKSVFSSGLRDFVEC